MKARLKKFLKKTFRDSVNFIQGKKPVADDNFIGFDKYKISGAYHWSTIENNPYYRRKAEEILRYVSPETRCLDVGSGDGAISGFLAQRACEVVGVDADVDAIKLANEQVKKHQIKNCHFLNAPMSKIDPALFGNSENFDLIYSMDVIEHLPQPDQLLEVSRKVLKKGGRIIIGTPLFISQELVSPYHVKEFTLSEIREILSPHMIIEEEKILPELRLDNQVYDQSFYMAIGVAK